MSDEALIGILFLFPLFLLFSILIFLTRSRTQDRDSPNFIWWISGGHGFAKRPWLIIVLISYGLLFLLLEDHITKLVTGS